MLLSGGDGGAGEAGGDGEAGEEIFVLSCPLPFTLSPLPFTPPQIAQCPINYY